MSIFFKYIILSSKLGYSALANLIADLFLFLGHRVLELQLIQREMGTGTMQRAAY